MYLRSLYIIRVNRVSRRISRILIYKIQNLSPPIVFKILTRGFPRYKAADIAKKNLWSRFFILYFIRVNRVFHRRFTRIDALQGVFLVILIYEIQSLSPIGTLSSIEFLRYLDAVFDAIKVLNFREKKL